MTTPAPAIIFDLDGTLVDTAPDLHAALNAVLLRGGYSAVSPERIRHLVGHGVRALLERALTDERVSVAPDALASLIEDFLTHYRAHIADTSKPFAHVRETLAQLAAEKFVLTVCTNKPQDLSELLLGKLDLARFFAVVHGAGRAPYRKPDPRVVDDIVAALGGMRERCLVVGDSETDVSLARAAHVPIIAVSYGYTAEPAAKLGADAVADDFRQIPELARKFLR